MRITAVVSTTIATVAYDEAAELLRLDSYFFNHKQKYFNNSQAASSNWSTLRMDASAL